MVERKLRSIEEKLKDINQLEDRYIELKKMVESFDLSEIKVRLHQLQEKKLDKDSLYTFEQRIDYIEDVLESLQQSTKEGHTIKTGISRQPTLPKESIQSDLSKKQSSIASNDASNKSLLKRILELEQNMKK